MLTYFDIFSVGEVGCTTKSSQQPALMVERREFGAFLAGLKSS